MNASQNVAQDIETALEFVILAQHLIVKHVLIMLISVINAYKITTNFLMEVVYLNVLQTFILLQLLLIIAMV
jgi:hypothetical protein